MVLWSHQNLYNLEGIQKDPLKTHKILSRDTWIFSRRTRVIVQQVLVVSFEKKFTNTLLTNICKTCVFQPFLLH